MELIEQADGGVRKVFQQWAFPRRLAVWATKRCIETLVFDCEGCTISERGRSIATTGALLGVDYFLSSG